MQRVAAALEGVKIYTDHLGLFGSRLANFTSLNSYTDDGSYSDWLLDLIDKEAYWVKDEKTVPIRREKIKSGQRNRGLHEDVLNTTNGRNKIYDNIVMPTTGASEHGENQLLGCIYELDSYLDELGREGTAEFLLLMYSGNAVRLYELKDEVIRIKKGSILSGKIIKVKKGKIGVYIANIKDWKEVVV